jgi:hypothetical protein
MNGCSNFYFSFGRSTKTNDESTNAKGDLKKIVARVKENEESFTLVL